MTKDGAIIAAARGQGRAWLAEDAGKALLAAFGVPVPRGVVVRGVDGVEAAAGLAPPLTLKVLSPKILHKSDARGVVLGLEDLAAVSQAIRAMAAAPVIRDVPVDGFLVEEMCPPGHELVIGARIDPHFGPVLMAGLGGVFVEALQDVAFRICPITDRDARSMLRELRAWPVLEGARGGRAADIDAVVDILLRLGGACGLLETHGHALAEVDLNPVIVGEDGAVAVDARFVLAPGDADDAEADGPLADLTPRERFGLLFAPRTVAVVGASARATTIANTFIRRMRDFGYPGAIYPVHPTAETIEGFKAWPSLAETPEPVDYAYVAVGAAQTPDLLAAAAGRVRFAQVISSGFGEVAHGRELETELVRRARAAGCRVIGPNCLGLYSPRGGVTFPVGAPREVGPVGVLAQSGGLSTDIIKRGQWRGLRFSGLVTIGNGADVGAAELLDFYLDDPLTRIIGLYLEDASDARRLFESLRSPRATKPVVILKGGRSRLGEAAALSHTGALAGDSRLWRALAAQTPAVLVETIDQFIDALQALQYLTLRTAAPTRRVALFGNGGGSGVLAVDYFAERGLEIAPFPDEARSRLQAMDLPPGTSVDNPIDTPVRTLQEKDGAIANEILDIVYQTAMPDAVVMHLNLAAFVGRGDVDPVGNLIAAALRVRDAYPGRAHFLMVLRVDGSPELDAARRTYAQAARDAGIPVFDELSNAAEALAAVSHLERRLADRA